MSGPIPPPGVHGGDGARIARALGLPIEDILDLSASLNPVAPAVAAIVANNLDSVRRYPDVTHATDALAAAMGVEPDELLLTNGGAEAINLVAGEVGGTVASEPEFSLYPRGEGVRWRSNPQSPSGELVDPQAAPWSDVQVWDEAFYPMAIGRWTTGVHRHGRIVVGSLTKLYACPGLRLGYLLDADPVRMARLRAAQPTWSVGTLAAAVLIDLLALTDLTSWAARIAELRSALVDDLRRAVGDDLRIEEGAAPWVWVHDAAGWRDHLAREGIVVRDGASLGRPGAVRIAVPDDADRRRLVAALRLWSAV